MQIIFAQYPAGIEQTARTNHSRQGFFHHGISDRFMVPRQLLQLGSVELKQLKEAETFHTNPRYKQNQQRGESPSNPNRHFYHHQLLYKKFETRKRPKSPRTTSQKREKAYPSF
jgi:hypothetical protein